MIPSGLFTQIGMVVVAIGIIVTYIQPTFERIGDTQDNISVYEDQRKKVVLVNSQLESLVSKIDSVSSSDLKRLLNYMPNSVDAIDVPRDLFLISNMAGVVYNGAKYSGNPAQKNSGDEIVSVAHTFTISVEGTYTQIKKLFSLLEQNHYPLEIESVHIQQEEGSFLGVDISLVTYEYTSPLTSSGSNKIDF